MSCFEAQQNQLIAQKARFLNAIQEYSKSELNKEKSLDIIQEQKVNQSLEENSDDFSLCSILCLNSLFVLITKHNMQCDNFYSMVYRSCQEQQFKSRFRGRFFQCIARFLSSKFDFFFASSR